VLQYSNDDVDAKSKPKDKKKIAKTVPSKNATYHAVENCVALH
jgi:hypothetical protein